jgi:hypothetical protein
MGYSDIRARDAAFMEMADAQSGKVMKDIHGNWVRVQQYILRPSDMEVQFLNVSLRGGDGPLAGISAMDFTTTFANDGGYGINQDLRNLPWYEWLNTVNLGSRSVVNSHSNVVLDNMYVKFANPGGESLKETRTFNPAIEQDIIGRNIQRINAEQLEIYAKGNSNTFNYISSSPGVGEYSIASNGLGAGFYYDIGGNNQDINVAFHAVGDEDASGNYQYPGRVDDIWDALAVNESFHPTIGNGKNLEIVIDPTADGESDRIVNTFNDPIDVVYVPMSRMLWKDKEVVDVN